MGVIAFVPQYPLCSDFAGKIRHVRVPRGNAIQFNKATQEFKIPPNTRFYKTFLKRIVDTDGNPSWRKIETRLIVSRPDAKTNGTRDGVVSPTTALFGSYLWNAAETDAILIGSGKAPRDLVDPISMSTFDQQLKEGDGFPDTILAYETNAGTHETRHYAVPSATRCIQCHMGSSSQSFVLGFRPVELRHWPVGQQGVIEESGYDEMQLLQRLIDYGIVTGMASPSDVLPLDQQGDRPPRNDKELTAQGYALGNCAHCHNPRGYPSITFPILKDTNFSLLPGPAGGPIGHMGGLFQFPLEKTSPRITRGTAGDVQIAYITPSLVDNPSFPSGLDPNTGDTAPISRGSSWKPKWQSSGNGTAGFVYAPWRSLIYRNLDTPFTDTDDFAIFPHMPMNIPGYDPRAKLVFADWMVSIPAVRKRPDIDEYAAPYPYDSSECEASSQVRFARCPPYSDDNVQPYVEVTPGQPGYDDAFQAAEERLATFHAGARPSDTAIVKNRCAYTPNTTDILDPAVLKDPVCNPIPDESGNPPLLNIPEHPHWVQLDLTHTPGPWVPRRPDWSSVFNNGSLRCADPSGAATGAAGTCSGVVPNGALSCSVVPASFSANVTKNEQCVVDTLNGGAGCALGQPADTNTPGGVTLDPVIRTYADPANPKTQVPMGLWKEKPECNWTREPWKSQGETVAQARAVKPHPAWLDRPEIDPMAHVYKQVPGEAVFGMICVNCHGPNADSRGRLADNLATMTGGSALVADFLDGLFGPACPAGHCTPSPGSYRADVFSNGAPPNEAAIGVDDRAARYMAWMALGGTKVVIPKSFLTIVGQSPVFGESRPGTLPPPPSANMLSIVRELCLQTLQAPPFDPRYFGGTSGIAGSAYLSGSHKGGYSMLWDNGDAELWLRLCAINNPPPLAQYVVNGGTGGFPLSFLDYSEANEPGTKDEATGLTPQRSLLRCAFDGTGCAADAGMAAPQCYSVGDESGNVFASAACAQPGPGLTSPGFDSSGAPVGNWHPWCVDASFNPGPTDPWLRSHCLSGTDCDMSSGNCLGSNCVSPPRCPDGAALDPDGSAALWWAQRGAINAGLAVFLYLDAVTKHTSTVYPIKPTWDHCELLAPASP
jgi:mono/diheme cytochrome c family protein